MKPFPQLERSLRMSRRAFVGGVTSLAALSAGEARAQNGPSAPTSVFDFMSAEQREAVIRGEPTDTTDALRQFFDDARIQGGGHYVIPPYTFPFAVPDRGVLGRLQAINDFTLDAHGSTLADLRRDYVPIDPEDNPVLLEFSDCQTLRIDGLHVDSADVREIAGPSGKGGLNVLHFTGINRDISLSAGFEGCLAGVWLSGVRFDHEQRTKNISATILGRFCLYPLLAEDSGDDLVARITAFNSGRDFFLHGTRNARLVVDSTNQLGASIIGSFDGNGIDGVDLTYKARESNNAWRHPSGQDLEPWRPAILLQWSDAEPAALRGIRIGLEVHNVGPVPFGSTIGLYKVAEARDGRGHELDGLEVFGYDARADGIFDRQGRRYGTFTSFGQPFNRVDRQRNIYVHDLRMLGNTSRAVLDLRAAVDEPRIERVQTSGAFEILR